MSFTCFSVFDKKTLSILFSLFLFCVTGVSQTTEDTLKFVLHYPENETIVNEDFADQIDSVLNTVGFSDLDYESRITHLIIYGYTDNKGSARNNLLLSSKRAGAVADFFMYTQMIMPDVLVGFGEEHPIADNKTEKGRTMNRRVEVILAYKQTKIVRKDSAIKRLPWQDTVIVYEDGTTLKINKDDYLKIKDCLKYGRKNAVDDIYEDLIYNENDDTYFLFGNFSIQWCNTECISGPFTLSIRIPDSTIKKYLYELKSFARSFTQKQKVKVQKHRDKNWYLDVTSYCPFDINCFWRCGSHFGGNECPKKVKFVAKDGYKIVGGSLGWESYYNYKKYKKPRKRIKFRITCPGEIPELSVIAIKNNSPAKLFYAYGTEKTISFRKRCFNCIDKKTVIGKFLGFKIHKRLLRRKYIFREKDFQKEMK